MGNERGQATLGRQEPGTERCRSEEGCARSKTKGLIAGRLAVFARGACRY